MPSRSGSPLIIVTTTLFLAGLIGYFQYYSDLGRNLELEILLHWTGRISLGFFILIYVASPLSKMDIYLGSFLVKNRRQIGISIGISHLVHLCCLYLYLNQPNFEEPSLTFIYFGTVGATLMAIMVLTSNNFSQRLLGQLWKFIHSVGVYYLWLTFVIIYQERAIKGEVFALFVMVVLLGVGILRTTQVIFKPKRVIRT